FSLVSRRAAQRRPRRDRRRTAAASSPPTAAASPPTAGARPTAGRRLRARWWRGRSSATPTRRTRSSVRRSASPSAAGVGNGPASTDDPSAFGPRYSGSFLSDSPSGIALPVARLADASNSSGNFPLGLMAQVVGGTGPFRLRVWVSTDNADASASVDGVSIGLLTSLNGTAITVSEDTASTKVIAGRT